MWFNRCFLSWILLVVIGMAACSGDYTEVEVIPEPELVEEIIPKPTPEPVPEPEVIYSGPFDFLESWAYVDEQVACNDRVFTDLDFPALQVTRWNNPNPITTQWHVIGAPVCDFDKFYPRYLLNEAYQYLVKIDFSLRFPNLPNDNLGFYSGPGAFFLAPYQLRSATPLARDDALRVWNTV